MERNHVNRIVLGSCGSEVSRHARVRARDVEGSALNLVNVQFTRFPDDF